jgi:hypothetical protein
MTTRIFASNNAWACPKIGMCRAHGGCGGTGASASLALHNNVITLPASRRLASAQVALATGNILILGQTSGPKDQYAYLDFVRNAAAPGEMCRIFLKSVFAISNNRSLCSLPIPYWVPNLGSVCNYTSGRSIIVNRFLHTFSMLPNLCLRLGVVQV